MSGSFASALVSIISKIGNLSLDLSWLELFSRIRMFGQRFVQKLCQGEMYEVLEYDSTLELHDINGEKATYKKRQKVRFLQDNIIAFEDQAWGDGKILIDYKCSPGTPVDRYRLDYKTYILISLRSEKSRGDNEEFNIKWGIRKGFLRKREHWGTQIRKPIRCLKSSIIFPLDRPPIKTAVIESNHGRRMRLDESNRKQLPDGRWQVTWEKKNPRLSETYLLEWEW